MVEGAGIKETKCRLLVVDDDTYVVEFFGAFFAEKRYEVRVSVDV